MSMKHT